jgi:hypothetical protein
MKQTDIREEVPEHRRFEDWVAYLYGELGFRIIQNVNCGGQEADIIASRHIRGVGKVRIIVECKWRKDSTISNQDVSNFHSVVISLKGRQLIDRGVMVTNRKFSQDSLAIADGANDLELLTVSELENQLFDLRHVFRAYCAEYEERTIFFSYISLHATWKAIGDEKGGSTVNVDALVDEWVNASKFTVLSVLADYGSGKTTLVERIKYIFARRYLAGETELIPLLLPLKFFWAHGNLDDFLRHMLNAEVEREIPLSVFWRLFRDGRFLLLLDGLDEITAESNDERRRESFLLLAPLLNSRSKVIITCRPAYFISTSDHNALIETVNRQNISFSLEPTSARQSVAIELLKLRILSRVTGYEPLPTLDPSLIRTIHLSSLTEGQIDAFLERHDVAYRQHCNCGWKEVRSFLFAAYDLRDLMTRPILLQIINETVLAGRIGIGSAIDSMGPSSLYSLYTSMKLEDDWRKGETRQLISKADRALFAEALAVAMFQSGKAEISYESLMGLAERGLGLPIGLQHLDRLKPEVLASDIRVCTFLTRTDDVFRFSHRSFLEFFVAFHLKRGLLDADVEGNHFYTLFSMHLPREILYFLGGFSISEPRVREELLVRYEARIDRQADDHYSRNLAGALLYSGPTQVGLRLKNISLPRIDLRKISLFDAKWNKASFTDSEWRDVRIAHSSLHDLRLGNCTVHMCNMDQVKVKVIIDNTSIKNSRFTNSSILMRSLKTRIEKSGFEECSFAVAGGIEVVGSSFIGGKLEFSGFGSGIVLRSCTFFDTTLFMLDEGMKEVRASDCDMINCRIFGLQLRVDELSPPRLKGCEGIIILTDCGPGKIKDTSGGVALVEDGSDVRAEIVSQNSGIVFVSEESWYDKARRKVVIQEFKPKLTKNWHVIYKKLMARGLWN